MDHRSGDDPAEGRLILVKDDLLLDDALRDVDDLGRGLASCAHCRRSIWYRSRRCEYCGTHFQDELWILKASAPEGRLPGRGTSQALRAMTLVLLLAIALCAIGLLLVTVLAGPAR